MTNTSRRESIERSVQKIQGRFGTVVSDPVIAVARFAVDSGLEKDRVENVMGVPFAQISPGSTLPAAVGPDLFALILNDGKIEVPSLSIAQAAPFSFFGGLERSVLLAPTGNAALKSMATNFAVFHDRLEVAYEESSKFCTFSFRFPGTEHDNGCCNEVVMGVLIRLIRSVFGPNTIPVETRLRYERNGRRSTYERYFGGKLVPSSTDGSHGFVFRRRDMFREQPGHDKELFAISNARLLAAAERRVECSPADDFLELINAANLCAFLGQFNVKAISDRVGFSERKAQRIAKNHGTTIAKLIESARLRLLREEVTRDPYVPTEDLSRIVGLSDSRALRRALLSWTGQSLREFRQSPFNTEPVGDRI